MSLLFKEYHVDLIIQGIKTATRRNHKYRRRPGRVIRLKKSYTLWWDTWIVIDKAYRQKLGDMTEEDAQKEGGYTLAEFKKVWESINGKWDPDEEVWVYEFHTIPKPKNLNGFINHKM